MTTDKRRVTIYLRDPQPLDDLFGELRRLAPLAERGQVSRSTAIEAAVRLALADLQAHGRQSAIFAELMAHGDATTGKRGATMTPTDYTPRCPVCGMIMYQTRRGETSSFVAMEV